MIDKMIAKIYVCEVFYMHIIWRNVSVKFIEVCIEDAFQCPLEVHKYGGGKVTETAVMYFCYKIETLLLCGSDTLKLHIILHLM